jgi:hypothetical protein
MIGTRCNVAMWASARLICSAASIKAKRSSDRCPALPQSRAAFSRRGAQRDRHPGSRYHPHRRTSPARSNRASMNSSISALREASDVSFRTRRTFSGAVAWTRPTIPRPDVPSCAPYRDHHLRSAGALALRGRPAYARRHVVCHIVRKYRASVGGAAATENDEAAPCSS